MYTFFQYKNDDDAKNQHLNEKQKKIDDFLQGQLAWFGRQNQLLLCIEDITDVNCFSSAVINKSIECFHNCHALQPSWTCIN